MILEIRLMDFEMSTIFDNKIEVIKLFLIYFGIAYVKYQLLSC